jgi:hypothetical protein
VFIAISHVSGPTQAKDDHVAQFWTSIGETRAGTAASPLSLSCVPRHPVAAFEAVAAALAPARGASRWLIPDRSNGVLPLPSRLWEQARRSGAVANPQ